jgi:mono/diheme cytochrome c family protein
MRRIIFVLAVVVATSAQAQDTATYFKQNCVSCHTIGGGRLTGPDLRDATKRKDREWLQSFILNPQAKISAGDPYALKMVEEARGVVMPTPPGITAERAGMLLDLIDAESALETSQFRGLQISNAPFTPADVARGAAVFRGTQPLKNGGPACVACHTAAGVGGLGGGRLGPDLMRVYERLQGRAGLSAWLAAPGTVTMRAVFEKHPLDPAEIAGLVAYFEKQSQQGTQRVAASQLNFLLYGLGGTVLGLVLLDTIWKGRLRGVRRTLTQEQSSRGES